MEEILIRHLTNCLYCTYSNQHGRPALKRLISCLWYVYHLLVISYAHMEKAWSLCHAEQSIVNTDNQLSTGLSLYQSNHFCDLDTKASLIFSESKHSVSFLGYLCLLIPLPSEFCPGSHIINCLSFLVQHTTCIKEPQLRYFLDHIGQWTYL